MQRLYTQILLIAFLAIMTITPIRTMAEDAISSEVVLKVANTSGAANENVTIAFNLALLDALPQHEFSTTTIWTEDLNTFSGVLLKDLIELTGFQGESVTAWAINDYMAEFSVGSLAFNTALIATRQNGDTMHPRDKGPLWIVFPYSDGPQFQTEAIFAQSVWQLNRLDVD